MDSKERKLKPFNELYELDLTAFTKKKPTFKKVGSDYVKLPKDKWLDYIEWSSVVALLYQNGAERVRFGSKTDVNGYPAFFRDGKHPFVTVWVDIDGDYFTIEFPVIDGNKVDANVDQLKIHVAQQRAFVKAVAINTGLGLKLWHKEEAVYGDTDDSKAKTLMPVSDINLLARMIKAGSTIEQIKSYYDVTPEIEKKINAAL